MKISNWLKESTEKLKQAGIGTARLDALVLLEDLLVKDRAQLLASPELDLTVEQINGLDAQIRRRAKHEPLAYILGKTEFYGREFYIDKRVLEPRPESETMIELLKKLPLLFAPSIADVGAGCGAIGITAALELPGSTVELLEIDPKANAVAKKNVDKFAINITVIRSDLLKGSRQADDVLLCNLPYVPDNFRINQAAMNEPRLAIFGGPDGLDIYRKLFKQISFLRKKPLYVLTESMPPQHGELTKIARSLGYKLQQTDDFIQVFTV